MQLHKPESIAKYLNLTPQRVRQLKDKGILREVRPGLYDLCDSTRRYINYIRQGDENLNYNDERAKLTEVKRRREELELREREKYLHESADVERIVSRILVNFKSRLLAVPANLSPILAKKNEKTEIYKLILEAIKEALMELANYENLFDGKEEEERGDDTATH